MILVILVVCILLVIAGVVYAEVNGDSEVILPLCSGGGLIGVFVCVLIGIWLCVGVSNLSVIDDKIAMYQEENQKIEMQIAETVAKYQDYESGIIKEVAPESAITLVALYPDLKADTLVQEQIKIYIKNNEEIKSLKGKDITGNVKRWWLYFGGRKEGA